MAVSLYKIKKWTKMLTGRSALHVHQDTGRCYSKDEIKGYYNDLTGKVLLFPCQHETVPVYPCDNGVSREFSIGIFQYGLGCYDLYLIEKEEQRLKDALVCADWAVSHQQEDGAWNTFYIEHAEAPYSSMAQGEGISLLCRAYIATHDEKYLAAAQKAYQFMVKPLSEGGTTAYLPSGEIILHEYTHKPPVLNGWIFSLWGIWDFCLLFPENKDVKTILDTTLKTLVAHLDDFETWHWTTYNQDHSIIASPSYHFYHVAQMKTMYELTGIQAFREKAILWEKWLRNPFLKTIAFCRKAWQKIVEK